MEVNEGDYDSFPYETGFNVIPTMKIWGMYLWLWKNEKGVSYNSK